MNNLIKDLYNLASQEKDEDTIKDCIHKIGQILAEIKQSEVNCFLSGENDNYDIYLEIHAEQEEPKAKTGLICYAECT